MVSARACAAAASLRGDKVLQQPVSLGLAVGSEVRPDGEHLQQISLSARRLIATHG